MAKGYLNDSEKTAKSFLAAPPAWMTTMGLSRLPNSRFYRTGDLARYTSDGKLVFVGRRDFQVKPRGQRIGLEEIQIQIQRLLGLSGAQVFVDVVDVLGDQRLPSLAAFVHLPEYQSEAHYYLRAVWSATNPGHRPRHPSFLCFSCSFNCAESRLRERFLYIYRSFIFRVRGALFNRLESALECV